MKSSVAWVESQKRSTASRSAASTTTYTCSSLFKATHALADVLRELKKASSIWVRESAGLSSFTWQEGYAALTVSPTSREAIRQ